MRARRSRARAGARAWATAALLCTVLASSPAFADPPTPAEKSAAASDNQKANAALYAKKYRVAAELYESSFKHVPEAKALFNAAGAWQKNGDLAKAATLYARYLKEAPDKPDKPRDKAKKELEAIAAKVGQLGITADGASSLTLDGETVTLPPAPTVYVQPGAHELEAKFGEKSVKQSPTAPAGVVTNVVLALPPEPPPTVAAAAPAAATAPAPPPKREPGRKPLPPLVVYVGAGATVIAGGLTVLSALDVSSQKSTFDADPSQENLDDGKSKQLRTNILLAVTGGFAVVTGALAIFFVDWKGKSGDGSIKAGAGPGSLFLSGSF